MKFDKIVMFIAFSLPVIAAADQCQNAAIRAAEAEAARVEGFTDECKADLKTVVLLRNPPGVATTGRTYQMQVQCSDERFEALAHTFVAPAGAPIDGTFQKFVCKASATARLFVEKQ